MERVRNALFSFGPERLLVLTTEEIRRDATAVLSRVARFLGITEPAAVPPVPRFCVPSVVNLALQTEVRSRLGPAFASATQALRRGARPRVEDLGDAQRAWVRRLVDNLSHETPELSAEEHEYGGTGMPSPQQSLMFLGS